MEVCIGELEITRSLYVDQSISKYDFLFQMWTSAMIYQILVKGAFVSTPSVASNASVPKGNVWIPVDSCAKVSMDSDGCCWKAMVTCITIWSVHSIREF